MLSKKISNYGTLTVSEQVILEIVQYVLEQYNPFIKYHNPIYQRIKEKVVPQQKNGIIIKFENNEIFLRLKLSVLYGECISQITHCLKLNIKEEINAITSFNVSNVAIQIESVHFDNI